MAIEDQAPPPPESELSVILGWELNRDGVYPSVRVVFTKARRATDGEGNPLNNALGMPLHEPLPGRERWALELSAADDAQKSRMMELLGAIYVAAGANLLAALGISKTVAEIQAAVEALAGTGVNMDALIAQAFEQLELDRRAGTATPRVIGRAP